MYILCYVFQKFKMEEADLVKDLVKVDTFIVPDTAISDAQGALDEPIEQRPEGNILIH